MTTASPPYSGPDQARTAPEPTPRPSPRGWFATARHAIDRPLTAYYLLLGSSALLLTIGLIMVLSASSVYSYQENDGNSYAVVTRQLMWVAIGVPCAFVASRLPLSVVRRFAWLALLVAIVLLALVRVPGLGREVHGNTNWLGVGPFVVQPAEVAKLAIVLWAAHIYARKDKRLGSLHEIVTPVVPGILLVITLVVLGKDLGTALVLMAILLAMLWVVGAPLRLFAFTFSGVAVVALYLASTSSERLERLQNFADPFKDFHKAGWQPAHGLYALSSGKVFGQGLGASRQKWGDLPEAHTDFIFAVLGEELGLIGTLLVIGLFLTIAYAAIRVARHTADPFVRYLSFGIVVWLLGQMIINVGMVLALLPVVGIPLPLVSYGGSALVPSLVALGLLIGFARREPEAALALAQRRKLRSAGLSAGRPTSI